MEKAVLGVISVALNFVAYAPYFRDIFSRKTKPHIFSWFIWMLLTGIAFAAQVVGNGGAGAWTTGIATVMTFGVFVLAFKYGDKRFSTFDWICFCLGLGAIGLWALTNNPVYAIILVTFANALAFLPTYRKGYLRPQGETMALFLINGSKYIFAVFALNVITFTTALYPIALMLLNGVMVAILMLRRRGL